MPEKDGVEFFENTVSPPETGFQVRAAYNVLVWIYEADGAWQAEAPELGLKESANDARSAYTRLAGAVCQLRNNRGKPKPLVLKSIDGAKAPSGAFRRILSVS